MANQKLDSKQTIKQAIEQFGKLNQSLTKSSLDLFQALGYNTDRQSPLNATTYQEFQNAYILSNLNSGKFSEERAQVKDWRYIDLLFQITSDELKDQLPGFTTQKVDDTIIESYLFFTLELSKDTYTRSALSQITREINKLFPMPVMVLFKYGTNLSLAIIDRRLHKKDEQKDVLIKVTLIKDIDIQRPHRAHIEILFDLSLDELCRKYKFTNFVELHQAWQKALDTKELNKKFYKELSNWYFWAMDQATFPDDIEKNKEIRNATSLIRLITRIIFIWFIKEKGLIPEKLFDPNELKTILKTFSTNAKTSSFYQAILQNLFFGTLNQKVNDRKFAQNGCQGVNKKEYGVKTLFRYDEQFTIPKEQVIELFQDIPFLNGGLFDCLDKENEYGKVLYADGFSRNPAKQAFVPDFLFFGTELEVDLNKTYDTKNKEYSTKGLIKILDSYKFTITENTPIEEEIALDPELLGKVFENLLASYNPETQTTARKSTGSFYTPREIVNYMVDESLIAYFNQKLEDAGQKDTEEKLRKLIGYNDESTEISKEETSTLIHAIDSCKILDPACGSGAFPMGILQKLVHVLHKVDPQNEQWKERQIQKARQQDISEVRDQSIADIESAFLNNELDYPRKLYLIENCIYGVDIQPIAIQIAKLRFFISLIIDQKKDPKKENLGIRSLPNLETKFVCANTLIGLEKPEGFFRDPLLVKKEEDLKDLRHDYFSSKTREQKLGFQKKDQALRKEISELLIKDGWGDKSAKQLSEWNPYDQNASSPFFDPEWMFGLTEGFDIVIGNPPYVQLQKDGGKLAKLYKNCNYSTFERTGDIYSLFYENGIYLLKTGGYLCYITSNKWMRAGYGKSLRNFFNTQNPITLIDLGPGIFENATVDTNIMLIQKETNKHQLSGLTLTSLAKDEDFSTYIHKNKSILPKISGESWFIGNQSQYSLKEKIEQIGKPLKEWDIKIYRGILTGLNEAFIIDQKTRDTLIVEDPKSVDILKPILRGRDIKRYSYDWAGLWLIFIPWHFPLHDDLSIPGASEEAEREFQKRYPAIYKHLENFKSLLLNRNKAETGIRYEWYAMQRCANTYYDEFEKEKVVWKRIGSKLRFGYDNKQLLSQDSTCIMTGKSLKYLCAYMNSKMGQSLLFDKAPKTGTGDLIVSVQALEPLLVPPITKKNQHIVDQIENLVEKIIELKKQKANTTTLENEIDLLVYQLYDLTLDEIRIVEGLDK